MKDVVVHVYDVANTGSEKTNNAILQINKIFKDAIGLGGIFHSAVQIDDVEWSFGFCETGSGVFSCPPRKNPMYRYRESFTIGQTNCSVLEVNRILTELKREWPGRSYELLAKNCNHFCDVFCERLGVPKLPAWINRFANAGNTTKVVAGNTAAGFRQAKTEILAASKVAYKFVQNVGAKTPSKEDSSNNASKGTPRIQSSWLRNLSSFGAKPSSSTVVDIDDISPSRSHSSRSRSSSDL